jgi:hypothetical protein
LHYKNKGKRSKKTINNPYGFIYINTNLINGKRYIGQKKFTRNWQYYLGSGKYLKNAINKYGKENFRRDIIVLAYSEEELNNLEVEWINNYNACKSSDFYNISEGGSGCTILNKILSKEHKIKISKAKKGKNTDEKHWNSKKIIQLSKEGFFINEFNSMAKAEKQTGICLSSISQCCKGKQKHAGDYCWMYAEDYYKLEQKAS